MEQEGLPQKCGAGPARPAIRAGAGERHAGRVGAAPAGSYNLIKLTDMVDSRHPSYAWTDAFILQNGRMVTAYLHDASGNGVDLMWRARTLHGANPHFKVLIYSLLQVYRDWGDPTIEANESWFLHNPDTSRKRADRVWRTEAGAKTYLMDIRNADYTRHVLAPYINAFHTYDADGLYCDGVHYNYDIPLWMEWNRAPTTEQITSWWHWSTTAWYPRLRSLVPSNRLIITSTTSPVAPGHGGYTGDDSAVLPFVSGTYVEYAWGFGLGGGNTANFQFMRTTMRRNLSQGKYLILNPTNEIRKTSSHDAGYYAYLLDADGKYLYYENSSWDGAGPIQQADPGAPTGSAVQNSDGSWSRPYTRVAIKCHITDDGKWGGTWIPHPRCFKTFGSE